MMRNSLLFVLVVLGISWNAASQINEAAKPVMSGASAAMRTEPLIDKNLQPPRTGNKEVNPKRKGTYKVIPGKGYPKTKDAALQKEPGQIETKSPILTFDAAIANFTPSDPTGAVGPNHYVTAWNKGFAIYDKGGNLLVPPASLSSLGGTFEGENLGDPIVFYDEFADRFLITQFSSTPNSFLVAVSQGSDPVNDGWYTYRFVTNSFPDYPKFFVWSDGYYVTANKDPLDPQGKEVVFVLERDKMLNGEEAKQLAFPLPGINNNGFYSPSGFFAVGDEPPPKGNAPIIYFQDDAWAGVNEDHLKIWTINVDWETVNNSTITLDQHIGPSEGLTPFIATFDGGSDENLSQPGDGPDVDALQGAVMYTTPYRRFETHNSAVLNFVVDTDASAVEHAGIRWYELRQGSDGEPWGIYQEGTYAPDGSDRWCGSIGIDEQGNIGMGFTIMNDNPQDPIYPSLRFTGRYADDPPGRMTLREETVADGPSPNPSYRYGDYAHLTIDPVDDVTFWYVGEYFVNSQRRTGVGVFKIEPDVTVDVGIVDIVSPQNSTLGDEEEITVALRNFGMTAQSNIPVEFSVDGGATVTEVFEGTIPRTSEVEFTFSTPVDLSTIGESYEISVQTNLENDQYSDNDSYSEVIRNLHQKDVAVTSIDAPSTGDNFTSLSEVEVTIENLGGEPQRDIPVTYRVDERRPVTEVYEDILEVGETVVFTFDTGVEIEEPGTYIFYAETALPDDAIPENDGKEKIVANLSCVPEGSSCALGDGIFSFYLEDIRNENIPCGDGYDDFIGYSTELDRTEGVFTVSVETLYAQGNDERFSMWIDFNDNGAFDEDEILISEAVIPTAEELHSYEFVIPEDAPLGEHVLRIRAGDTSFDGELNAPCTVMDYGTTHDYSIVIVDRSLTLEDSIINEAELVVSNPEEDMFNVRMITYYGGPLHITVHDVLGQKLVDNKIVKGVEAYEYELDMSYVATGVYLIRVGTRKVGKVKRIIVP